MDEPNLRKMVVIFISEVCVLTQCLDCSYWVHCIEADELCREWANVHLNASGLRIRRNMRLVIYEKFFKGYIGEIREPLPGLCQAWYWMSGPTAKLIEGHKPEQRVTYHREQRLVLVLQGDLHEYAVLAIGYPDGFAVDIGKKVREHQKLL